MIVLHKILPAFFLPFGVSLILLTWGLTRRRRAPLWAALVILLISSHPYVGYVAIRSAEGWSDRRPVAEVTMADAVVVLSAGRVMAPGPDPVSEWTDADRFYGGIELMNAGKAPRVVFTGAATSSAMPTEGEVLRSHAQALGVPAERIRVTGRVTNTADEAREVRRLLSRELPGVPRIVLVTSAFHMPRAVGQFRSAGFNVDPFPVDFKAPASFEWSWTRLVPSPSALAQTQIALREQYGRLFYWMASRF